MSVGGGGGVGGGNGRTGGQADCQLRQGVQWPIKMGVHKIELRGERNY